MAQRLIERACDRFRKEISPEDASEIASTASIDDVKLALGQIECHLAARGSLRNFDRIAPFLGAAERLSQVVEVVCNGTPYLPWIWAPVKFIVQSARDHAHVLDKVLMAYANIGTNMPRLSRYGEVFNDPAFQCMIAYLFEDILEFHRKAYSMLKKPGWTIFFSSAWGRFDHRFSSLLTNIERLSEQIDREAVALDIMTTAEWRSKTAEDASKREEQWQTQQLHATMTWLGIEDDIQEAKLEMNASKCYDGTCQWLTKSSKIRTWLQRKRGNSVLWLNGKPGSGKSILSSMLIRFLRSDPSRRVCFFFCDYNTSPLDIGTQVLRTICSQIVRAAPDLVPYVYEECLAKAQRSSSDVLKRIMPQLFSRFDDVNLVVDGIDELPSSEHRSLIKTLLQLSTACPGLKVLLVSQDLPTISAHLSKRPTLFLREEVEATRNDHAIMVEGSLKELNEDRNGAIGDALIEKLKKDILDKSEGMFLWVNLVMNLLRMSKSLQELKQQIYSLPKSLADIYQRILNNICHQRTASSSADIMRIFAWLKCHKGKQPMLKCEVRLGIALDGPTRKITRGSLPWADATDICKPLIEDGPGNTLVFVHSTVPQFLFEGGSNSFMSIPESIASVTFACICQIDQALDLLQPRDSTSKSTIEVACGLYGLLPYSYQYWTQHLIEFLSLWEQVPSSFSAVIMECLKQLCQKLVPMLDMDPVFVGTDTTSLLLQKFLTVTEAALITQMINRYEQLPSQGAEPVTTRFDAPSASLQEYRRIVCHVTQQSSIPGVEQHEFIAFKEDYGPTAFVCDHHGCDRSLRGYPSESRLASHRARHTQHLRCYEKDCSYNDVGFPTEKNLKDHKRKMHHYPEMAPIPKRLHKTNLISDQQQYASNQSQPQRGVPKNSVVDYQLQLLDLELQRKKKMREENRDMLQTARQEPPENRLVRTDADRNDSDVGFDTVTEKVSTDSDAKSFQAASYDRQFGLYPEMQDYYSDPILSPNHFLMDQDSIEQIFRPIADDAVDLNLTPMRQNTDLVAQEASRLPFPVPNIQQNQEMQFGQTDKQEAAYYSQMSAVLTRLDGENIQFQPRQVSNRNGSTTIAMPDLSPDEQQQLRLWLAGREFNTWPYSTPSTQGPSQLPFQQEQPYGVMQKDNARPTQPNVSVDSSSTAASMDALPNMWGYKEGTYEIKPAQFAALQQAQQAPQEAQLTYQAQLAQQQ